VSKPEKSGLAPKELLGKVLKHLLQPEKTVFNTTN